MDKEKLFGFLERKYASKREMLSRIPLGLQPDAVWQEVVNRRRTQSTILPLYGRTGAPYWYVTTEKMIQASEKIIETLFECESDFDPYVQQPAVLNLEEVFYTSYVEGARISMRETMDFLQSEQPPKDIEEQMITNNRYAGNFASANLYRSIDEDYLRELAVILTEGMDAGGGEYRSDDEVELTPVLGEEASFPLPQSIPGHVNELVSFLADPRTHPLIKAAVAQAWMFAVRPFPEGNERLGRILSAVILLRAGYTFFSDVSLSALIARKSYAYYEAALNITREENGGDLTYFIEFFLDLLSRAVDERKLRLKQKEDRERQEERELAKTALVPTAPAAAVPENTPVNSQAPKDAGNLENIESYRKLRAYIERTDLKLSETAAYIMRRLAEGQRIFSAADFGTALGYDFHRSGSVIGQLCNNDVFELHDGKVKPKQYRLVGVPLITEEEPVAEAPFEKDYSPELLAVIADLSNSAASRKERRVGMFLQKCLDKGSVTYEDYVDAGEESKYYNDMCLAIQLGLVTKLSSRLCRLNKVLSGPPELTEGQKKTISAMYAAFGKDVFTSEMVIATLDFNEKTASAYLHQFTVMRILEFQRNGMFFLYKFLVDPENAPEFFSAA